MDGPANESDLATELQRQAAAAGLTVRADGAHDVKGESENIKAKWWLGGRKVTYRMSCRLDEADHTVHFREAVSEATWGIPPPTFTVEKTTVKGWQRSGERTDRSVGGGGTIDFARVREDLKAVATAAGWQFQFEGGRMP